MRKPSEDEQQHYNHLKEMLATPKWYLPFELSATREMAKWKTRFPRRRDQNAKELRAIWEKQRRIYDFLLFKKATRAFLDRYRFLRDLVPHKPEDVIDIIKQLKGFTSSCPICAEKAIAKMSIGEYLRNGLKNVPRLKRVPEENVYYCPDCHEEFSL